MARLVVSVVMVSVAMVSVVWFLLPWFLCHQLPCALYPERVHSSFLLQLQVCQEAVSRECEEEVERWRVSVGVRECEEEVERWRVSVAPHVLSQ